MKVKSSFKYIFENWKYSLNTSLFTIIFILSMVLAVYGGIQMGFKYDYITVFISVLNQNFYSVVLLLVVLLNTVNINNIFSKNEFYIIRCETKKKYLIDLIKNVLFGNFCLFVLNILLLMIVLNVTCAGGNVYIQVYKDIPNIVSLVFLIIKFLLLTEVISIFNVLLLKVVDNKIVIFLNILLIVSNLLIPISDSEITNVFQLPLFINSYYRIGGYSGLLFEILCFLLYLSLLLLFTYYLYKFVIRKMRKVIE